MIEAPDEHAMHIRLTADERSFQEEAAAWLASHVPAEPRPAAGAEMADFDRRWQRTQFDGGWAGVSWPAEYGGRGLSVAQQMLWYEQCALADAPMPGIFGIALGHAGPTLILNGTDSQRSEHLPRILSGEEPWAQGFSEPNAGSDLAAVRSRGRIEDDHVVVNGQKIWSTAAQYCSYYELLIRTDPESTRHHGLTWIMLDLATPGVDVRPIATMNGEEHFCEVFLDDVRIPLENVVGGVGNGWATAMSTLGFERGTMSLHQVLALDRLLDDIFELARAHTGPDGRRPAIAHEELALRLATARSEVAALRALTFALISRRNRTGKPGPEGSMIRLFYSELTQRIKALAVDILGRDGAVLDDETGSAGPVSDYLYSFAHTIGAGTAEIQRSVIAQRVLGLPRAT